MIANVNAADVLIVGGGLVGLAAAAAVGGLGIDAVHLAPPAPPDRRTSALMNPSVDYLRSAGLVGDPSAIGTPLTAIRIIDATPRLIRAPETLFDSREAGLQAFGWNFPNTALAESFSGAISGLPKLRRAEGSLTGLRRSGDKWLATLSDGRTVLARLVVGAEGKRSVVRGAAGIAVRETAFAEAALVCDLELARPLEGTSVEFHYPNGPFTLVPAGGNRANLVWIDAPKVLEAARENFVPALTDRSMRLFGAMTPAGPIHIFPLSTLTVETAGSDGVVLVGEAAHAFPPIGAQGLNLGLRDVADLSEALGAHPAAGLNWPQVVSADFARRRAGDLARTGAVVDGLFRSLLTDMLPAQALRAGGLWALKLLPGLRRQAFQLGMGAR